LTQIIIGHVGRFHEVKNHKFYDPNHDSIAKVECPILFVNFNWWREI